MTSNDRTSDLRIFVAYPYAFPTDDYRRPFEEAARDYCVAFDFADELLTNRHVLDKIIALIDEASISLFDITDWNPNVTLELGVAIGRESEYRLLFNPTRLKDTVPSDLGGFDRMQYRSYGELSQVLRRLLEQLGVRQRRGTPVPLVLDGLDLSRTERQVLRLLSTRPEMTRREISRELFLSQDSIARAIWRLRDAGLVAQQQSRDGRTSILRLTGELPEDGRERLS